VSRADAWIRWSTAAVVILLAAVAAVVSYRHALEVIRAHGEAGFTAYLVPLTVDGLIYASSMVLLDCSRRGVPVPALARLTLGLGIVATLAANVAHGLAHGVVGAIVAAWPAVALVLAYETLMALIRRAAVPAVELAAAAVLEPVAEVAAAPTLESPPAPAMEVLHGPLVGDVPAPPEPVADVPGPVLVDDPLYPEAVKVFFSDVASGEVPPVRVIKSKLGVGQSRAVQAQTYLRTLVEA
jgi:hypothetical protein